MRRLALLVLLTLLSSCGGASQTPATAIPASAPTEEVSATATAEPVAATAPPQVEAEPVPLTVDGLSTVLIQDGDLPEGWTGDTVFDESPVDYDGPSPQVVLNQGLLEPDARFASGNVVLWVFESDADARAAYEGRAELIQSTRDDDAEQLAPPIGEQAQLIPGKGDLFVTNSLVFLRCKAVVEIDLGNSDQVDWATNYATRIDQRLQPSVCS